MKLCNTCHQSKPESEFYPHKDMKDGLLGRCKVCHKAAAEERRIMLSKSPEWMQVERERHRIKSRKYRQAGRAKPLTAAYRAEVQRRHRAKHPLASKARNAVAKAIRSGLLIEQRCEVCGRKATAHHEDYSKPLEVIWLCVKHHAEADIKRRSTQ